MSRNVGCTRKDKASELIDYLTKGPAFVYLDGAIYTPAQARYGYKLWCETWVIPLVKQLVPELRGKKP
jgi:hypothetical protein